MSGHSVPVGVPSPPVVLDASRDGVGDCELDVL